MARQRRNFTDEAVDLFTRFSLRYGLSYDVVDAPIEVCWKFPVQEKLIYPLTLGLQNLDELNFGLPGFWSFVFPFPDVAKKFENWIDAWAVGEARVVHRRRLLKFSSVSKLEVFTAGDWSAVAEYRALGGISWPHPNFVIQNSADERHGANAGDATISRA